MNVLILGATGFIGPAVLRRLVAMGHAAIGVSRNGAFGPSHFAVDRNHPEDIAALVAAQGVDSVIDLLAMSVETTAPLLETLSGRIHRYVLASSADVYRQYGALHRREGPPRQEPLDETAPLRSRLYPYRDEPPRPADDPSAWMDTYDKIPVERAVAATFGDAGVIVRLPMVYGPGDRQRRFAWAIRPMSEGADSIPLDAAWADWRTTYGFVEDVAEGLALAAVGPCGGRTYNLGAQDSATHLAWARRLADAMAWKGAFEIMARDTLTGSRRRALDALDLDCHLILDSRSIRADLGYSEVTAPTDALARTIKDELSRG